jgi:hypothetical protein
MVRYLGFQAKPNFCKGSLIDAKDTDGIWYESVIISDVNEDGKVKIHYRCWEDRWDEVLSIHSDRLAPHRTHTQDWRAKVKSGTLVEVKEVSPHEIHMLKLTSLKS